MKYYFKDDYILHKAFFSFILNNKPFLTYFFGLKPKLIKILYESQNFEHIFLVMKYYPNVIFSLMRLLLCLKISLFLMTYLFCLKLILKTFLTFFLMNNF